MTIEGRHFLGTASKRNFSVAYSGQQSLTGSVGGITLINGWPLRFPIGSVTTSSSTKSGNALTLAAEARKGDTVVTLNASTALVVGDYLIIDDLSTTKSEVRRIVHNPSGHNWRLNYPLSFNHANAASCEEIGSSPVYTHRIQEENELDTVTWHVHM